MADGIPESKGQIHEVFSKAISLLQSEGLTNSLADKGAAQRVWANAEDLSPLVIADLGSTYDRAAINTNYVDCLSDGDSPGTVGDVVAVKTQGDILATMERGFRARHASSIRCRAHAAARRQGHGHAKGIFSEASGPLKYVTAALTTGQQTTGYGGPTPPPPPLPTP
jgi:hypothetical protein